MLALVNLLFVSETLGTQAAASGITARAKQLLERIASDRLDSELLVTVLTQKSHSLRRTTLADLLARRCCLRCSGCEP